MGCIATSSTPLRDGLRRLWYVSVVHLETVRAIRLVSYDSGTAQGFEWELDGTRMTRPPVGGYY